MSYLDSQQLLPENQHGFRGLRSTVTQLLSHLEDVMENLESGKSVDVIYTDFSKAFDKCETNVLLHSLRDSGVKGRIGKWLAAFLDPRTRKQAVGVDGRVSSLAEVVSGVPQGTVLTPILFLIHISRISSSLSAGTSSSSFADDTRVWKGVEDGEDCEQLQRDLEKLYDWANMINMQFNSKKFEWIRYQASDEAPEMQYLAPNSSNIEQKESLRDLGVTLSCDLSFAAHINGAVQKANQLVGWALRTFRGRSSFLLITILKSLVQPHLDYCCHVWSPDA